MPKRSNEFQELVALIQRALAPEFATVQESVLVETEGEQDTREIDVLIETKISEYSLKIAVEAKDEGRKMDSTKFESIVGKYLVDGGVRVNKVVVITHRGFYKPVIERAMKLGVDLLTLKEARELDWAELRPPGPCFRTYPQILDVAIFPEIGDRGDHDLAKEGMVVCSCGWHHGPLQRYAEHLFWTRVVNEHPQLLKELDEKAFVEDSDCRAHVKVDRQPGHEAKVHLGNDSFLIQSLSFDVRCSKTSKRPPMQLEFSAPPYVCYAEVVPPIEGGDPLRIMQTARIVCSCCEKDHGTVQEWANATAVQRLLPQNREARSALAQAAKQSGTAHLEVDLPLCTKWRIRYGSVYHKATHIRTRVHASSEKAPLECKQFDLALPDGNVKRVSQLQATLAGKQMTFLLPDGLKSQRIALRIDDKQSTTVNAKKADLLKAKANREKRKRQARKRNG